MPRLLLVDDNPSIHKIAETLLAATDVQLVCAGSGADALALIERGERFDVALLDTSMAGMDGWDLLDRLRGLEATAKIPVAMMAGVLDLVDPDRLTHAPMQGFLKKPVELRDLGDRVRRLMETPVLPPMPRPAPAPEPEAQPAAGAAFDAVAQFEAVAELEALAKPAPVAAPEPEAPSPFLTHPGIHLADHPGLLQARVPDDLLILEPGDLYPEEPAAPEATGFDSAGFEAPAPVAAAASAPAGRDTLDLEELDLDSLRGLSLLPSLPEPALEWESEPAPALAVEAAAPSLEEDAPTVEDVPAMPEYSVEDAFPGILDLDEGNGVTTGELPDLGPEEGEAAPSAPPAPGPADDLFDWSDDSDSLVLPAADAPAPVEALEEREDSITFSDLLEPEPAPAQPADAPATEDLSDFQDGLDLDLISEAILTGDEEAPEQPAQLDELEELDVQAPAVDGEPAAVPPPAPLAETASQPVEALAQDPAAAAAPAPSFELLAVAAATVAEAPLAAGALASGVDAAPSVPAPASPATVPTAPADALAALLADPVLMDRLAKAVVSRLGDQALREIAWEIMPELADRLHRN